MADRPTYVLDASVAGKWHLLDEEHTGLATTVLADYRRGLIDFVAPAHMPYEVASAIRKAQVQRRLEADRAADLIRLVQRWGIPLAEPDFAAAYQWSMSISCSFYDGLYLAMAEAEGVPILTADRRLVRAMGTRFPHYVWIGDYRSPIN